MATQYGDVALVRFTCALHLFNTCFARALRLLYTRCSTGTPRWRADQHTVPCACFAPAVQLVYTCFTPASVGGGCGAVESVWVSTPRRSANTALYSCYTAGLHLLYT